MKPLRVMFNLPNQYRAFKRPLFQWLATVFNRVSEERIKEVGPDRACAEWLLRNGAAVKWKDSRSYLKDYDSVLSKKSFVKPLYIEGVDATDSGISHDGFPHFSGCKHISEMKLVNCIYIGNNAIRMLELLKDSLECVEISNCGNVSDKGLLALKDLQKLRSLKLSNLPAVENAKNIKRELEKALPNCNIDFENGLAS